jgi:Ca2+/Na+ antiporter
MRSLADFGWLAILTLLAVLTPLRRSRLNRMAAALIIGVYVIFVLHLVIAP